MKVLVRSLGLRDYTPCWHAMQAFTDARTEVTPDEFWLVEHRPIFTLGRAGKREHLLSPRDIRVVKTDRGGQVTYHGPGQLLVYTLLDVRRQNLGPRELVRRIEQSIIDYLAEIGIAGSRRTGAPGVYVDGEKIAALGLRIRRGYSYHGVALNVAMDLEPYQRINPCGYAGLKATQLVDHGGPSGCAEVGAELMPILLRNLYPGVDVQASGSGSAVTDQPLIAAEAGY